MFKVRVNLDTDVEASEVQFMIENGAVATFRTEKSFLGAAEHIVMYLDGSRIGKFPRDNAFFFCDLQSPKYKFGKEIGAFMLGVK